MTSPRLAKAEQFANVMDRTQSFATIVGTVIAALVILYRRGGIRGGRARGKEKTDKSGRKLARPSDEDEEEDEET